VVARSKARLPHRSRIVAADGVGENQHQISMPIFTASRRIVKPVHLAA
jgi:hypothetical protein